MATHDDWDNWVDNGPHTDWQDYRDFWFFFLYTNYSVHNNSGGTYTDHDDWTDDPWSNWTNTPWSNHSDVPHDDWNDHSNTPHTDAGHQDEPHIF